MQLETKRFENGSVPGPQVRVDHEVVLLLLFLLMLLRRRRRGHRGRGRRAVAPLGQAEVLQLLEHLVVQRAQVHGVAGRQVD